MKAGVYILFFLFFWLQIQAEGTKELMPSNTGNCYLQFNESIGGQRYFAMSTNTDPLHRLYIHIANVGEIINFGFKKLASSVGDSQFRIKDASGTVVYAFTAVPTSGAGYISTFSEADIGPNTLTGGTGGYTPLTYTTVSTGDFYIEFEKTTDPTARYLFEYFDITVSSGATPISGRVWSYAWDLNTESYTNASYSSFYVYSDDKYVTNIDLNGIQPYSFVIACNNTGAQNTGDLFIDRQSVDGTNTVYPKYKIFLNTPDPNYFDEAVVPTMVENLSIVGTPTTGNPVEFYINMSESGTLEIFLDIDGDPGYQSGGRDVVLVETIAAGGDQIYWDGNDGLGAPVTTTITVIVSSKFATGVTHLPIYDAEQNSNGYLVTRVAPDGPEDLVLYWDDSQIIHGTIPVSQEITMLEGNTIANGHIWTTDSDNANGFGDGHTLNSWWNGYEINNLASFDFILLPIELVSFTAVLHESGIELEWNTASETNNHYFNIQRSLDGIEWNTIAKVNGAGTSTNANTYKIIDNEPVSGTLYYRLQQVDFDGANTFSDIIAISFQSFKPFKPFVIVITENGNQYLKIENAICDVLNVFDSQGKSQHSNIVLESKIENSVIYNISNLAKGLYFITLSDNTAYQFVK